MQSHVNLVKEICFVEGRLIDTTIWECHGEWTIQRVVRRCPREAAVTGRRMQEPVHYNFVRRQQFTSTLLQVTLEVVAKIANNASTVKELKNLSAVVGGVTLAFAVHRALREPLCSMLRHIQPRGSVKRVVRH